ncbi:MAG: phosphoribosylanthranilate isomerase [Anaerolineae bacterium]|nr:phosphoribosylanthranilate isomerase [Thermoflexales bacterium]MDW8408289.1 phosphoribosylanthranilate isomerase [Anaerolineae bacterium]
MTIVKICGLTCLEDARCALEAGADMLGFILYPKSPRFLPPAQVAPIVATLRAEYPALVAVGVFVNLTPAEVVRTLDEAGLDLAQLSGDEPVEQVYALHGRAYKAVREAGQAHLFLSAMPNTKHTASGASPSSSPMPLRPDLLLDANHPTLYGGSGMRADELLADALARQCRLLLAGGLTPENVVEAVRVVRPWGVDVSSGVERAPGRKDHAKVRAFVAAAKSV